MEHLLSALLDALADPTVSYIGLGYDTTIGISTGKLGHDVWRVQYDITCAVVRIPFHSCIQL